MHIKSQLYFLKKGFCLGILSQCHASCFLKILSFSFSFFLKKEILQPMIIDTNTLYIYIKEHRLYAYSTSKRIKQLKAILKLKSTLAPERRNYIECINLTSTSRFPFFIILQDSTSSFL